MSKNTIGKERHQYLTQENDLSLHVEVRRLWEGESTLFKQKITNMYQVKIVKPESSLQNLEEEESSEVVPTDSLTGGNVVN